MAGTSDGESSGLPLYIIGRAMPPRDGESRKRSFFANDPKLAGKDVLDKENIRKVLADAASYPGGCAAKVSLIDEHVWGSSMHEEERARIGTSDHLWMGKDGTVQMLGQIHDQKVAKQVENGEKTGLSTWLELDLAEPIDRSNDKEAMVAKHNLWHVSVVKNPRHPMARILWKGRDVNEALALTQLQLSGAEAQSGTLDPVKVAQRVPGQRLQLDRIGRVFQNKPTTLLDGDPMQVDSGDGSVVENGLDFDRLTMRNVPKSMIDGIMDASRRHPGTRLRFGVANAALDVLDVTICSTGGIGLGEQGSQVRKEESANAVPAAVSPVAEGANLAAAVVPTDEKSQTPSFAEPQAPTQMQSAPPPSTTNAANTPAAQQQQQQQQAAKPVTNGAAQSQAGTAASSNATGAAPSTQAAAPGGLLDSFSIEEMVNRKLAAALQSFVPQQQQQQQPASDAANSKKREREEASGQATTTAGATTTTTTATDESAAKRAAGTDATDPNQAAQTDHHQAANPMELALLGVAQQRSAQQMEEFRKHWAPELDAFKEEKEKELLNKVISGAQSAYVQSYMELIRNGKVEQANQSDTAQHLPSSFSRSLETRRAERLAAEADQAKKQIEALMKENEALKAGRSNVAPNQSSATSRAGGATNRPPPVSTMVKNMDARMDEWGKMLAEVTTKQRQEKIASGLAVAAAASADPMPVDAQRPGNGEVHAGGKDAPAAVGAEQAAQMASSVDYLGRIIGMPASIAPSYLDRMVSKSEYDQRPLTEMSRREQLMVLAVTQHGRDRLSRQGHDPSQWNTANPRLAGMGLNTRPTRLDDNPLAQ